MFFNFKNKMNLVKCTAGTAAHQSVSDNFKQQFEVVSLNPTIRKEINIYSVRCNQLGFFDLKLYLDSLNELNKNKTYLVLLDDVFCFENINTLITKEFIANLNDNIKVVMMVDKETDISVLDLDLWNIKNHS